jgi:glutamate-5-semialdehyde dehydrogenase
MTGSEVVTKASQAKAASYLLAQVSATVRNAALIKMGDALEKNTEEILAANHQDVTAAREKNTPEPLIDRLMLDNQRLKDMADALRELADLPDPIGYVTEGRTLYNGIKLKRVRVPLGVIAIIYEARPNVTADAAGLALKSANACILRGGSLANNSNIVITRVLAKAAEQSDIPAGWLQVIETTDRSATNELMQLHSMIDVLIPRGSASLIRTTVENSKVPVIETGEGNCHLYIHHTADPNLVVPIAINAKTQRPGVCNAIESILIDENTHPDILKHLLEALAEAGVCIHAAESIANWAQSLGENINKMLVLANDDDWGKEYLDMHVSIKQVTGVSEAIEHINRFSTHHSESIIASDAAAINQFLDQVDSACVYANASTRFTDGGQFGLGAEIGISTQKLHARGPMGLEALTSTKFILEGNGQIR